MEHVSSAGFMTESERETYESIETTQLKYWIPFTWYINTLNRARKQGLIASDITLDRLVNEMNAYRGNCGMLQSYDWICIPLVYTQVVCVAVYGYFVLALFGRQRILGQTECSSQLESNTSMVSDSDEHFYGILPIHTLLEFFFYMGWMKVAEQLINPFGMDDEDYEVNMIIDRNLEVSFLAVDTLHDEGPADADDEDIWVGKTFAEAPYTEEALEHKKDPFLGSTANIGVSRNADFVPLESVLDLQADDSALGGSRAHLLPTESNHLMSKLSIRSRGSEKNSHRRRLLSSAESDKSDYSESFIGSSRIINPYRERGGPNEFTHQHSFRKDRHVDRFGSARSESDSHVDEHEFQASASREAMHLDIKSEKQSSNTDSAVGSPVEPVSNRVVTLCDGKTKVVPAPAIITTVPNNPNDPVNSTGDVVLSRNLTAVEEQPEISSQPSIEELEPAKMSPIQNSWRVS